jgi:hypothetical protein
MLELKSRPAATFKALAPLSISKTFVANYTGLARAVGVPTGLIDGVSAHQATANRHQGIFPGVAKSLPA